MFDFIITSDQIKRRDKAKVFTKWVHKEVIMDMDAEKWQFPHDYAKAAGKETC